MNNQLRNFFIVAITALLSCIYPSLVDATEVTNRSVCIVEINRMESIQHAVLKVADARIALERWRLKQLKSLRERGHASWLEVARQQLVAGTLDRRRSAITEFSVYNQSLLKILNNPESLNDHLFPADDTFLSVPLKLSLPGSVRIVAWIHDSQLHQEMRSRLNPVAASQSKEPANEDELAFAREELLRAEKIYKAYASNSSSSPHHLRQAELKLALKRAEVQLLELDSKVQCFSDGCRIAAFDWDENKKNSKFVGLSDNTKLIRPQSNCNLATATWRVVKLEANAASEIEAAKVVVQQMELRFQALKDLHANQHATNQELDEARDRLASANRRVEELSRQKERLTHSCQSIELTLPEEMFGKGPSTFSDEPLIELNMRRLFEVVDKKYGPPSMELDIHVLRHLLELRCRFIDSVAKQDEYLFKLKMLDEHLDKLKQIINNSPDSPLQKGTQRQIADMELEIRYNQAMRLACQERSQILAAEERRFIEQCVAQQQVKNWSTALLTRTPLHVVSLIQLGNVAVNQIGYLESDDLGSSTKLERLIRTPMWADDLWLAVLRKDRFSSPVYSWPRGYTSSFESRNELSNQRTNRMRFTSDVLNESRGGGLWSSRRSTNAHDAYPFGILRADLRRHLTPGQHPWYLPGSATNYGRR